MPSSSTQRLPHLSGLIILVAGALACAPDAPEPGPALPEQLHGLPLVEQHSGEEAAGMLGRMHDGAIEAPESHIGYYGSDEMRTTVYVSRYDSAQAAAAQVAAMAARIGPGAGGYGHHAESEIGGTPVHSVLGHGQVHYFYARGPDVIWLAAPPMLARPALAELMGVPTDSVPRAGPPPAAP